MFSICRRNILSMQDVWKQLLFRMHANLANTISWQLWVLCCHLVCDVLPRSSRHDFESPESITVVLLVSYHVLLDSAQNDLLSVFYTMYVVCVRERVYIGLYIGF